MGAAVTGCYLVDNYILQGSIVQWVARKAAHAASVHMHHMLSPSLTCAMAAQSSAKPHLAGRSILVGGCCIQ